MKRYIYSIIAIAAMVITGSCAKEENNAPEATSEGRVFTAYIENTKTTIDANDKQSWENGDEISINGIVYTASLDEGGATATFTKKNSADPDAEPVNGKYIASFPVSLFDDINGTATLSTTQNYIGAGILSQINPLYAEGESTDLHFYNICGLLELKVKGEGKLVSISVNDGEKALSGAFTINSDYAAVLTDAAKSAKAGVTLDCGEGVQLSSTEATIFHIAVPADSYSKLTITMTDSEGKTYSASLKEGVTATVLRNSINPISLTASFHADYCLGGIFSVGEGKTVKFTSSNVSFNDGKWTIDESQNTTAEASSLFFWTSVSYGAADSYSASDASELDWGKAFAGENLTTLSSAEWDFLLNTRTMANGKARFSNTVATPVTIDGKEYKGLFIYPDNYNGAVVDGTFSWEYIDASG